MHPDCLLIATATPTNTGWLQETSIVPHNWNATLRGKPGACLAAAGGNSGGIAAAKCFTQPYAYAYVGVPTFVVQSFADPANLGFCYQMPCGLSGDSPGSCNASEVTSIKAYGKELRDSILAAQEYIRRPRHKIQDHGYLALPCPTLRTRRVGEEGQKRTSFDADWRLQSDLMTNSGPLRPGTAT